jgi:hypothetical protein
MDCQTANALLAAILETVAAGPSPSGVMYAAMMGRATLDDYQGLIRIAESVGLVTVVRHEVTITDKGRETVAKIRAARAARVSA